MSVSCFRVQNAWLKVFHFKHEIRLDRLAVPQLIFIHFFSCWLDHLEVKSCMSFCLSAKPLFSRIWVEGAAFTSTIYCNQKSLTNYIRFDQAANPSDRYTHTHMHTHPPRGHFTLPKELCARVFRCVFTPSQVEIIFKGNIREKKEKKQQRRTHLYFDKKNPQKNTFFLRALKKTRR